MKWYCIIHYVWFVQNIFLLCPYIVWFRHFLLMCLYLAIIMSNNVYVCKGYCLASVSTIYRLDFGTNLYFFVGFMLLKVMFCWSHCFSFSPFCFGRWVFYPCSIYGFWVPLGIFKLLCQYDILCFICHIRYRHYKLLIEGE